MIIQTLLMYKGKDRKRSAPAAESIFNRRFVPLFVEMEKTSIEHRLFFREKKINVVERYYTFRRIISSKNYVIH
jgi:hypothetical protein